MSDESNIETEDNDAAEERLSPKEYAKKQRRKAYELAKERQKTDPRYIAMKEKLKQQRRDAYQKSKEWTKTLKAKRKLSASEKVSEARIEKEREVMGLIVPASSLETKAK